jgi:hypothetical protein
MSWAYREGEPQRDLSGHDAAKQRPFLTVGCVVLRLNRHYNHV